MKRRTLKWIVMILAFGWLMAGTSEANTLFKGRRIYLGNEDNRAFKIGVTGTTAGYNYFALIEDARQESVPLGDLGYWEMVDDPPSTLRNYDLQLIVKNTAKGKFKIGFEYDKDQLDIRYRILEGKIQVKLDTSQYYPVLMIDSTASDAEQETEVKLPPGSKRFLFFDFNSFDADLRTYYGRVKRLMGHPDYSLNFYYYESGNYNSYYFKTYQDAAQLDTDKMGLSLENGTLAYYQGVLDNLKNLYGSDFASQIVIISRFGKEFARQLKAYAKEIGMSKDMVVTFWSYDDIE